MDAYRQARVTLLPKQKQAFRAICIKNNRQQNLPPYAFGSPHHTSADEILGNLCILAERHKFFTGRSTMMIRTRTLLSVWGDLPSNG